MANHFWINRREIAQNNGLISSNEYSNEISNSYQSPNGRLFRPQSMLQLSENHPMSLNNFTPGRDNENEIVYTRSVSVLPLASPCNNTTSFITAARYGGRMPLCLLNGPRLYTAQRPHMARHNIPLTRNSIPNGISSTPIFHNRRSLRYLPYGQGSNNARVFNDFNTHPRINFHGVNMVCSSGNNNRDLVHERELECEKKELLLLRDERNSILTTSKIQIHDANENDVVNLDLSLHL